MGVELVAKRLELLNDVPDSNYETVMMLVELPSQVNTGLHTHAGFARPVR